MQLVERIETARQVLEQRPRLVGAGLGDVAQQLGDAAGSQTAVFRAQIIEELLLEIA